MLAAVREFGAPLLVGLQPMPYWVLQSAFDALAPKGMQWYWKADFFTEITDEAMAAAQAVRRDHPHASSPPCTCTRSAAQ